MIVSSVVQHILLPFFVISQFWLSIHSIASTCLLDIKFTNGTSSNISGLCVLIGACDLSIAPLPNAVQQTNLTGSCEQRRDSLPIVCCPSTLLRPEYKINALNLNRSNGSINQTNFNFDEKSNNPTTALSSPSSFYTTSTTTTTPLLAPSTFFFSNFNANSTLAPLNTTLPSIWTTYALPNTTSTRNAFPASINSNSPSSSSNKTKSILFANCGQLPMFSSPSWNNDDNGNLRAFGSYIAQVYLDQTPLCLAILISDRHLISTGECNFVFSLSERERLKRVAIRLPALSISNSNNDLLSIDRIEQANANQTDGNQSRQSLLFPTANLILFQLLHRLDLNILSNQISPICVAHSSLLLSKQLLQIELQQNAKAIRIRAIRPIRSVSKDECLNASKSNLKPCFNLNANKQIPTKKSQIRPRPMVARPFSHSRPLSRFNANFQPFSIKQSQNSHSPRFYDAKPPAPLWTIYPVNPSASETRFAFSIPSHSITINRLKKRSIDLQSKQSLKGNMPNICSPADRRRFAQQIQTSRSIVCVSGNITDSLPCIPHANSLIVTELSLSNPDLSFDSIDDENDADLEKADVIPELTTSLNSASFASKRLALVGLSSMHSWCNRHGNVNSITSIAHTIDSHFDWLSQQIKQN